MIQQSPVVPLTTWAPDLVPSTEGILVDCSDVIPTHRGFCNAPTPIAVSGLAALPDATANAAALVTKLDNSRRLFVGLDTKLMEQAGGGWTDVSKSGGYTSNPDGRWQFSQFGNSTLAANGVDPIQISSVGAFASISGAPKAKIIESAAGFVMAAATNDATYGDIPDRWWCSALFDPTSWTPSVSTQCATGRLVDTPGPIVAVKKLGNDLVAYKETSIYLGRYVGAPAVWAWQLVADNVGAVGPGAVVNLGSAHIFVGKDDIWYFDGSRPVSLNAPCRYWFFENSDVTARFRMFSLFNRLADRVWFFFVPNGGDTKPTRALVYHVKRQAWGLATGTLSGGIGAVVDYISPATTYGDVGTSYLPASTWDDGIPRTFDSPVWFAAKQTLAVVQGVEVKTLTGQLSAPASMQFHDRGADDRMFLARRCRPSWVKLPSAAQAQILYKMHSGDPWSIATGGTMQDGKLDFLRRARWLAPSVTVTAGDFEVIGLQFEMDQMGIR